MDQKKIAMVIIAVGIVIALVGLLADVIGVGSDPDTRDFGTRQVLVIVVGVIILAAGLAVYFYGDKFIGGGTQDEGSSEE